MIEDDLKSFIRDMQSRQTSSIMRNHWYIGYEVFPRGEQLTIKAAAPETTECVLQKLIDAIKAESLHGNLAG